MPPIKVIPAGPYVIGEDSINDVPLWRVSGPRLSVWCGDRTEAVKRRTELNVAYAAGKASKRKGTKCRSK